MSLPPRSTSHNGDDSAEDDASSVDEAASAMESADEPAPDVGFFRDPTLENWACIKNGTVIASVGYQPRQQQSGLMASGKSLHFSALSSLQHASALASDDSKTSSTGLDSSGLYKTNNHASSQKVSLPVHGFRSFGGLQNSLAPDLTSPPIPPSHVDLQASCRSAPRPRRRRLATLHPTPRPCRARVCASRSARTQAWATLASARMPRSNPRSLRAAWTMASVSNRCSARWRCCVMCPALPSPSHQQRFARPAFLAQHVCRRVQAARRRSQELQACRRRRRSS